MFCLYLNPYFFLFTIFSQNIQQLNFKRSLRYTVGDFSIDFKLTDSNSNLKEFKIQPNT